uniref:Gag polyprotein n=1 Tax=Bactrocera latifrons TaxID=174628 RepID=A0A0K8USA0_BACLA
MNQMFGSGENRVVLRRKFETRKWKSGERFIEYFNDKLVLANQLQLGEEELAEYIIDSIPGYRLRNQAYMQCYKTKAQLLQAFSKIETGRKPIAPAQSQIQERRCYNCSSRGHLAAECRKPKREMGTCYGCGSRNHQIATCPEKKTVHAVNEYNV